MSFAKSITKSIKAFSGAFKIKAVSLSIKTLDSLKLEVARTSNLFKTLKASGKSVPVTQVAKQMTNVPEASVVTTAKAVKGKKIPKSEILTSIEIAKTTGDIADAATQKAIAKALKSGVEVTPAMKKAWVSLAVAGGVMLAMVGVVLGIGLATYAKMDKARLVVTSISNEEKLDEKLAGVLEYYDKGENMAALDTKRIPPPTKDWHLVRINYRYPEGEDEDDDDFEISVGHEIETDRTKSSPSIDQTRYVVMDSGKEYVIVAVPFRLKSRASEGGTITIHYNLDYEMAALIDNMDKSAGLAPGPRDEDDAVTEDGITSKKNPFQDIEWGWLLIAAIVLMMAMMMVSIASRSRARPA